MLFFLTYLILNVFSIPGNNYQSKPDASSHQENENSWNYSCTNLSRGVIFFSGFEKKYLVNTDSPIIHKSITKIQVSFRYDKRRKIVDEILFILVGNGEIKYIEALHSNFSFFVLQITIHWKIEKSQNSKSVSKFVKKKNCRTK